MATPDPMQQQPMAEGMEPSDDMDADTFETMVAGLTEHLYGAGEKAVVTQLKESKDIPKTVGLITHEYVKMAAEQGTEVGRDFDLGLLLDVATEIAESIFKMAAALKLKAGDPQDDMLMALVTAVEAYNATLPPGSEQQEDAKAMLAQMQQDGSVDEAAGALQQMGAKQGIDPFAPKETPMATGVRAGLMTGA